LYSDCTLIALVSLRRQVSSEKTKLSELERTNTELKARADVYASELAGAQASLDDNGAKLAAAEQAAERAAAQLLETQRQAVQAAEATDDEQRRRAVTNLTKLEPDETRDGSDRASLMAL